VKKKVVPSPTVVSNQSLPFNNLTKPTQMGSPKPVAEYPRASSSSVLLNLLNTSSFFSGGIPGPVSRTKNFMVLFGSIVYPYSISPEVVNLKALSTILLTTCSIRLGSDTIILRESFSDKFNLSSTPGFFLS